MDVWIYVLIGIVVWAVIIGIIAAHLTRKDKKAAENEKWRVKEATLMTVAALGGSLAMLITMRCVRHKTKHKKFMIGIPIIIFFQIAILVTISLLYFLVWR